MKELFDMHCHIVPDVDDGADNRKEALEMLRMEYQDGVRHIIVTPHDRRKMFETPSDVIESEFRKLCRASKEKYPDLNLYLGREVHARHDLAEYLEKESSCRMAGSSFVLLEFSEGDSKKKIRDQVYELLTCGYEPILAHVERYEAMLNDLEFTEEMVEMGAHLQVNVESILGQYTWKAKRYCRNLMKEDLLGFVGSDAHHTRTRTPNIGEGAKYVAKKMGESYADRIFHHHPMKLICTHEK